MTLVVGAESEAGATPARFPLKAGFPRLIALSSPVAGRNSHSAKGSNCRRISSLSPGTSREGALNRGELITPPGAAPRAPPKRHGLPPPFKNCQDSRKFLSDFVSSGF